MPPTLPSAALEDLASASAGHPPQEAVRAFSLSERLILEGFLHPRIVLREGMLVKHGGRVLHFAVCESFPTALDRTAII